MKVIGGRRHIQRWAVSKILQIQTPGKYQLMKSFSNYHHLKRNHIWWVLNVRAVESCFSLSERDASTVLLSRWRR
jgi:hypothetical protein